MIERLIITLVLFCPILSSCSLEDKAIRSLRGHTISKQGIAHGASALHAERYCQHCHGVRLMGGREAQPSCYQCHGQRWIVADSDFVFAPSSHTLELGGYRHHDGLDQVATTCTACHGGDLLGLGDDGPPSCYLCHEQVWTP